MDQLHKSDSVPNRLAQVTGKLAEHDKIIIEKEAELTVVEWQLLSHICQHPDSRLTELSTTLNINTADLVMANTTLMERQLVTTQNDLETLFATDIGQLTYLSVVPKLFKTRGDAMSNLSSKERQQLSTLLSKVALNLDTLLAHIGEPTQMVSFERTTH